MKKLGKVSALLVLCVIWGRPLSPAGADDKKADAGQDNKLAPLERFLGEWVINSHWSNGEELHARTIYDWGIGKKFIVAKTFVKDGDKEYQRYEGVLGWHPKKKTLFEISFAFNGEISEYILESKDENTIQIGYTPFSEGQPNNVRQTLQFKDKDHFVWTVLLKMDGEWKQIIEGTWERKNK